MLCPKCWYFILLFAATPADATGCRRSLGDLTALFEQVREGIILNGQIREAEEKYRSLKREYEALHRVWKDFGDGGPGTELFDRIEEEYLHSEATYQLLLDERSAFEARVKEAAIEDDEAAAPFYGEEKPRKEKPPAPKGAKGSPRTFLELSHPENSRVRKEDDD